MQGVCIFAEYMTKIECTNMYSTGEATDQISEWTVCTKNHKTYL